MLGTDDLAVAVTASGTDARGAKVTSTQVYDKQLRRNGKLELDVRS